MIRLYINNFQVELKDKEKIGYTKQVNSLKDLSSRQTNFTYTFGVPKTSNNIANFKGLGLDGNTSNIPYQKNNARLFVRNYAVIVNGKAVIEETEEDYKINIYDGNIDFFKALDNEKFDNIPLPELEHERTVAEVKNNWLNGNDYYRYLLANYNGKVYTELNQEENINVDYLIPSVKTSYLWDRIFSFFNFSYSGSVFNTDKFKDLFITYPKEVKSEEAPTLYFKLTFSEIIGDPANDFDIPLFNSTWYPSIQTELNYGGIEDNANNPDIKSWKCDEAGYYTIKLTGTLSSDISNEGTSYFSFRKNEEIEEEFSASNDQTIDIDVEIPIALEIGDVIDPFYTRRADRFLRDRTYLNFQLEIYKSRENEISQLEFLKGLTPKDFYREIMWRFGLTPFAAKDTNHIDFLTYDERINSPVEDWSDKFVQKVSEKYIYGNYAKQNNFTFKYNGEGDDFNDGYFNIDNELLEEKKDVIKSKTYSIEQFFRNIRLKLTEVLVPVVELWKRELKEENGEPVIEYKSRDSRFTFLRAKQGSEQAVIGSEKFNVSENVTDITFAETADYSWQNVVNVVYKPINDLFNKTKVVEAILNLNIYEFDKFTGKHPIYIKQLGGNFLVNKISKRDLTEKETKVELIKINK